MFNKQTKHTKKTKKGDKLDTQENPVVIFQPLSSSKIIVGNVEEEDEYKTEPFPERRLH